MAVPGAVTVMANSAELLAASAFELQVTVVPALVQAGQPAGGVAETNVTLAGKVKVSKPIVAAAEDGPRF